MQMRRPYRFAAEERVIPHVCKGNREMGTQEPRGWRRVGVSRGGHGDHWAGTRRDMRDDEREGCLWGVPLRRLAPADL